MTNEEFCKSYPEIAGEVEKMTEPQLMATWELIRAGTQGKMKKFYSIASKIPERDLGQVYSVLMQMIAAAKSGG